MLITLGFYKRKAGLTWEEFSTHWRDVHGPSLADNPELSRYMIRYVQHHISPSSGWGSLGAVGGVGVLEYDGFSESWFESLEARKALHSLPYFQETMIEDERKFLDMDATRILMFDKQVVQIGKDYAAEFLAGRT